MAKRRKNQDLFSFLLPLCSFIVLALSIRLTNSLLTGVIAVFGVLIIFGCINIARIIALKERLRKLNIHEIDRMEGFRFEKYVALLLEHQNYKTTVTRSRGDYGADLIAKKDKEVIVIQVKRYKNKVGIESVQQVIGSLGYYKGNAAWVVTNSYFTDAAIQLAKANNVKLIDRNQLIKWILSMNPEARPSIEIIKEEVPRKAIKCSQCGSMMVIRKGKAGEFWGCSQFPKCRNTLSV